MMPFFVLVYALGLEEAYLRHSVLAAARYCRRRYCTSGCMETTSCYKLVIVYLFLYVFKQDTPSIYSSYKTLKQKATPQEPTVEKLFLVEILLQTSPLQTVL